MDKKYCKICKEDLSYDQDNIDNCTLAYADYGIDYCCDECLNKIPNGIRYLAFESDSLAYNYSHIEHGYNWYKDNWFLQPDVINRRLEKGINTILFEKSSDSDSITHLHLYIRNARYDSEGILDYGVQLAYPNGNKETDKEIVFVPDILPSEYIDMNYWQLYEPEIKQEVKLDMSNYPHKCPKCNSAAYVGLSNVECTNCGKF